MVGSCRFKSIWMLTLIHSVYFTLALDPPSNLRVAELGSDFVTVAWTAPVSGADSFDATISPTDDGESSTPQFFNTSYATWRSLTPGKTYMVEVTSIKSGETPSFPTILTLTTLPASPFNIKVSKFINPIMNQFRVTGSRTIMYPVYGAVVSWDQPEFGKFDDFLLSIDPSHGKIRVPIKLKSGLPAQELTEQKRIVWDLLPGILYEFTVQSKSNGMLSNPLTGQERMPPEIPGSISVDKVDSTSVDISWGGEHRGMLDGYVIETDPDGGVAEQVHGDPLHQKRRVTNLTPGTKYKVELYSTMAGLLSFKPSVVEFKTPPAVPLNKVRSEEVRAESVFITWNPPPGKMDYYEVVYFPTDRDFGRLRQRVWEPRVNMTTLDPGSSYQVEIHAISNDLTSKPLIETVYTKPLPPNKVITTATQSTIVLSWETVYYDGSGKIEYYPEQNETESITRYLEPGMTELTITKLDPGTNYVVRVSTIKSGVESDAITMITRTATIAKTPPSDNIPVPREPATEETIVRTTITSETTQGIAALVQETTAAETETFETTAATTRESEATTSKRTTIKQSTTTPTEPSTEPTTKTSIATTTTTTTAPTTPTSTIQRIETTKEQRIPSSSTITEGTVRATETTTTSTAATIATSATTPTSKPVEFTEAKQTVTTSTHGQTTKEYTTTKFESRSTTDEHTTQASTSRPSTVTEAATQPTSTTASTVELTTAESTTQSRTTDEATSPATIATTKLAETTTDISAETETIFIPPPFPFEENPGPPEKLEEGPTEYTTEATIDEITAAVDIETFTQEDIIITEDQETITIRNGFKTICDPNNITVLVDKNVIGKYEEQFGPLHFNADDGQDCRGVEYEKYYRYTVAPNILGCGTQFEVNDTHVNFTNTVSNRLHHEKWYEGLLDPSKSILIGRKGMKPFPLVHMNFYCTFPLEMTVHTDLIPDLRVEVMTFNVSGVGQFSAMMQLFKDDEYRHPYFAAPSLRQDQILRAGITLLKNKDEDISIAVRKCWATPVSDVDYDTYYPLIDDYCPLEDALKGNLTILENGKSKRSRWEGPVFKFVRFPEVWLHCELKVCFGDSCNTTCDGSDASRSRRAAGMHGRGPTVSAGPIHASREKIVKPVSQKPPAEPEKTSGLEETTVIIIVTVLSAAIILMCILFALIIIKCRRRDKDRKPIAHPESIASSTLSSRGRDNWEETGQYHVKKSPKHTPAVDPVLPPVPTVLGTGNFPERFDVIEEVSAPASGYGNPAFESTENNMR